MHPWISRPPQRSCRLAAALITASITTLLSPLLCSCDGPVAGHGVGLAASQPAATPFDGFWINPVRVRVRGEALSAADAPEAEAAALASLSQRLDATTLATLSSSARVPPHRRLSAHLDALAALNPDGQRALSLSLRLQGQDSFGPIQLEADVIDHLGALSTPLSTHLDRAADLLLLSLTPQLRALGADDHALSQTLVASLDVANIKASITEVARRRAIAHAPALQRLLIHPDREVTLASLGALAQLRHAPSVPLIRDLLGSSDPEKAHAALYALSDIGGPEAIRVLSDVADHALPPLRDLARSLRDRAMQR
jgi:hypothetical protein